MSTRRPSASRVRESLRGAGVSWWPQSMGSQRPDGTVIRLRPLTRADREEWEALYSRNDAWLRPWMQSLPGLDPGRQLSFRAMVRRINREARAYRSLSWVIEVDGALAGQVQLNHLHLQGPRGGSAGYWVDERLAGQGIAPWATAMMIDQVLLEWDLHRVEVNICPANEPSLRVAQKLGLRREGLRERFLFLEGSWRDHVSFAVTSEELRRRCLVERLGGPRRPLA